MMNKYFVVSTPINGVLHYAVCKIKDTNKPMHSGNIEFATSYSLNNLEMQKIAKELNQDDGLDNSKIILHNSEPCKGDIRLFLNNDFDSYLYFCQKLGLKPSHSTTLRTYYRFIAILKSCQEVKTYEDSRC